MDTFFRQPSPKYCRISPRGWWEPGSIEPLWIINRTGMITVLHTCAHQTFQRYLNSLSYFNQICELKYLITDEISVDLEGTSYLLALWKTGKMKSFMKKRNQIKWSQVTTKMLVASIKNKTSSNYKNKPLSPLTTICNLAFGETWANFQCSQFF